MAMQVAHMAARIDGHYSSLQARGIEPRMIVDMLAMFETLYEVSASTPGRQC